jgi:hypothetical protein
MSEKCGVLFRQSVLGALGIECDTCNGVAQSDDIICNG